MKAAAKAKPAAPVRKRKPVVKQWRKSSSRSTQAYSHDAIMHRAKILPVPGTIGEFVHLPSIHRSQMNTVSQSMYLIVQHTASDVTALMCSVQTATGYVMVAPLALPQITNAAPVTMRPQRLSVSLRNITKNDSVGGLVRVANIPQHLKLQFHNDTYLLGSTKQELFDLMGSGTNVRSYAAHEFLETKQINAPPASLQEFKTYRNYQAWDAADVANSNYVFYQSNSAAVSNQIIVEFTPFNPSNTYDITIARQDACRFAQNSVLSHLAHPAPAANEAQFNAAAHAAQAAAAQHPVMPAMMQ